MSKKLPLYILGAILGLVIYSCNSNEDDSGVWAYTSVAVESFRLTADDSVLVNLDSVYFSIDLNGGKIYNADSLPKGTNITKLVPKIGTTSVSSVQLIVNRGGVLGDTVYNYLADQHDSIDFSHGPVILRITSQDRSYTRDYEVKVNVHNMTPDSLYWNRAARRDLPTSLSAPTGQKSVDMGGKALCLTVDASGAACAAVAEDPSGEWTLSDVTLPAGAVVRSLTAVGSEDLYIVTSAGDLYKSTDMCATWSATSSKMTNIVGAYGETLFGTYNDSGSWKIVSYPDATEIDAPAGFPVAGTSVMFNYTSTWSDGITAVVTGGEKADGTFTGVSWAYDGYVWKPMSTEADCGLPAGRDYSIIPYFAFKTNSAWQISRLSCLLAFGGSMTDGINSKVYISWDRGISWKRGDELLQMPDYIKPFTAADALVFDITLGDVTAKEWQTTPVRELPVWWQIAPASRATVYPTTWECPYIYIFGGVSAEGILSRDVWRGVINRLSFKPLF